MQILAMKGTCCFPFQSLDVAFVDRKELIYHLFFHITIMGT